MDVFELADGLGPAKVLHVHEPSSGLRGIAVIDNVARGPAIGGMRMAPDVGLAECARLARAMTFKNAAAGLRHGGGKSVLFGDPRMPRDRKERLIRAFAAALRQATDYIVGPDMGTDEGCMAWVWDEIGRAVGLPRALGGIPLDEIGATGWGVAHAARAAETVLGLPVAGARVAVQGYGAVGMHAARFLVDMGARLVAASDSSGTTLRPEGLDVAALAAHKRAGRPVAEFAGGSAASRDAVIEADCDIWIPAARPDVIHAGNAHGLRARLILQGANIPITAEAEEALHRRGVWSVPDFIANAGGVICAAMEYQGATEAAAMGVVAEKVLANTEEVLRDARARGTTPRAAAVEMARARVVEAMAHRRFAIYA